MNAWDELIWRCADRRRKKIGPLSDQAFEELLLAVRENPEAFVDHTPERALLFMARALDAYRESCRNDDLLDDESFERQRAARLAALHSACQRARESDESSLDANLLEVLSQDPAPDRLLDVLLELEKDFSSDEPPEGDAWDDIYYRSHLRLRAVVARTCLDTAHYRMAQSAALSVMDATPADPLGARHTYLLACARLEDEPAFDAACARYSHQESAWSHLARVLLLYKLGRMSAARRALRGYDELCRGGAYALLRPTYVEIYLPDRPDAAPCSFEECLMAVREAEPIIADVPDFIGWCQGFDWLVSSAARFAERNDLDW